MRRLGAWLASRRDEKASATAMDDAGDVVAEAWREGGLRSRSMLDAIPLAVYAIDAQGRVTYFNRAAVEVTGRTPTLGTDKWCVSWKLRHPDGRPMPYDECPMAVALREERPVRGVEILIERPDGSLMPCLPCPTPVHDAQGRLVGAVNVVIDLTETKRAAEAAARLAAIVDSSDDAIVGKTLEGVITSWNRGAEAIFGYTAAEAVGQHITLIIPEERHAEENEVLARLRRGEKLRHFETVRRAKDGRLIDISLTVSPVRDEKGRIVGASKIARDITERKRVENALRESEQQLSLELAAAQRLQETSSQLIREGDVEALHDQILDTAAAIMRSDFASMQILHPERGEGGELRLLAFRGFNPEAARFWEWVRADSDSTCGIALRTGERVIEPNVAGSAIMAGTQDQAISLQTGIQAVQSTPLVSRSGVTLGMLSTHWREPHAPGERDLRLLDVLARQAADVIERTQAQTQLRDSERRKDEFLATLSHELRNPLAPIRNAVQLLKDADPESSGLREQALGILDRQVAHMTRLVEDLLDLTRISRGSICLQRRVVPLADIVRAAVETSRPLVDAGGHSLHIEMPDGAVMLHVDPVRLAQVISNLINNSAKYTPRGGRIQLAAQPDAQAVTISVRDNGIGITLDLLPRLFEMFARGGTTQHAAVGGLGIGLALARQLVELHGGTIEARSDGAGRGAEFTVRVPFIDSKRQPVNAGKPATVSTATRRVLVADDKLDA